jgi:hypothetical protein
MPFVSFGAEEVEMGTALRERLVSKDAQFVKIWELPSQKLQPTKKWTLDLERVVAGEAEVVNNPFVAVDKHDSLTLAYLPHHLQSATIQETENALKELQIQYPPPHSQVDDGRHYEMDRLRALYPNERIGKYHFAWWCAVGHPNSEPVLSTDSRGGPESASAARMAIASKFVKRLAPLSRVVSSVLDHRLFEVEHEYGDDESYLETGPVFSQHQIL